MQGSASLWSDIDYGGDHFQYTYSVNDPDLDDVGFDNRVSSLKVEGSITLYEHDNYQGRAITFTSTPDPNENLGSQWNSNPALIKAQGKWDSRVWGWDLNYLELMESDSNNRVTWDGIGNYVESSGKDTILRRRWVASNFDQGYAYDNSWVPDLRNCGQEYYSDYVGSLKLQGTVTLYEQTNYGGASITIGPCSGTGGWIPDITQPPYSWPSGRKIRSLHLQPGGSVTVFALAGYVTIIGFVTFATPSFQPPLLRIGDLDTITLEGLVSNWYSDDLDILSASWTGVKFDVWAVPNSDRHDRALMMGLYFQREGINQVWGPSFPKPLNMMYSLDCFPEHVQRIEHPPVFSGQQSVERWKIDVKWFLTDAGIEYGLPISDWRLAQISFTVESGSNLPRFEEPLCYCSLEKLRLCYTMLPSGGCPYVYAWNGTNYVKDNNILPASENGNGTDVEDHYKLEQPLVPFFQGQQVSLYSLQLLEFEHEHDYIDQVNLLAVDHSQGTSIAVTPEGEILTYQNPVSPASCVDNYGNSRLGEVGRMDGNVSMQSTFFQGYAGDWLLLNFGRVTAENAKLILRDDQKCADVCINVQVPDQAGNWQTVEVLHPRDYWAIEAVNLTAHVPANGDFIVRLLWTATHRLDYVGLDTTSQEACEFHQASVFLAVHSTEGNVIRKILENDQIYTELVPGERIQLAFFLPSNQNQERTFILHTEGHYNPIT